ncbi:MAG: AAA-like domain-containing protein [Anaerolineae bacterium]|nr:AAA-like domain-containing protein [Anaerolineae bacterium]
MDNFRYRGPLAIDSPLFYGRQSEFALVGRHCLGQAEGYPMVFAGRQSGKTSFLFRLLANLQQQSPTLVTCRVDFQSIGNAPLSTVCGAIARRLRTEVTARLATEQASTPSPDMKKHWTSQIHATFSLDELRSLCFAIGIDPDDIRGNEKRGYIENLIAFCERRSNLDELIRACQVERPDTDWRKPLLKDDAVRSIHDLYEFIERLLKQQTMSRLVIAFEEPGALSDDVWHDLANLIRSIYTASRESSSHCLSRVAILLSGSLDLFDLTAREVSPLRNVCEPIYLPDLNQTDAVDLVSKVLQRYAITSTQAEQHGKIIYERVAGHPYLTQRLGAFIECQLQNQFDVSPAFLDEAIANMLQTDPLFKHIRQKLSERNLWPCLRETLAHAPKGSQNDEINQLHWLGMVKQVNRRWYIRNKVFEQIF